MKSAWETTRQISPPFFFSSEAFLCSSAALNSFRGSVKNEVQMFFKKVHTFTFVGRKLKQKKREKKMD
jgi:hypothetical protein